MLSEIYWLREARVSPAASPPAQPTGQDWPVGWQQQGRYLPWRAVARPNGTMGKVPLGGTGHPVNPLNPHAWQSWASAWQVVAAGGADGVGLTLTPALGLTAIDLDACLTPTGDLTPRAARVLETFAVAYAEYSPSGQGLHVLVRGTCPSGWRRQPGLEIITHGFVTVTGQAYRLGEPDREAQLALEGWHTRLAPVRPPPSERPSPRLVAPGDWFERACQARNGARFRALWAGEAGGCATASEGDVTLLLLLLYWQPRASDTELAVLLRSSGRARPKVMDDRYLARTLAAARRWQRASRSYRPAHAARRITP